LDCPIPLPRPSGRARFISLHRKNRSALRTPFTAPHIGGRAQLIVDPWLGLDSLAVGVLHLDNFADRVGQLDHLRVGIPPGQHEVHLGRFFLDDLQDLVQVDQFQVEGVVDLIQDEDIRRVRLHLLA